MSGLVRARYLGGPRAGPAFSRHGLQLSQGRTIVRLVWACTIIAPPPSPWGTTRETIASGIARLPWLLCYCYSYMYLCDYRIYLLYNVIFFSILLCPSLLPFLFLPLSLPPLPSLFLFPFLNFPFLLLSLLPSLNSFV